MEHKLLDYTRAFLFIVLALTICLRTSQITVKVLKNQSGRPTLSSSSTVVKAIFKQRWENYRET